MIAGIRVIDLLIWGGMIVIALAFFDALVGARVIKFKGRTHLKVHRWLGWTFVVLGALHGALALAFFVFNAF
jgi:hypothetical protein